MGKKVLWLPCVASGVIKTNISAKPVTLVTDKRREFAYFNQVWPRKSRATTRASWELTTGYRGTELIRWINLSQIRFRIWPAALPRQVLLAAALNVRVASRLTRRRKAGPRMNGRRTLPGRTPRGLASSEEGSKSRGQRRAGHGAANRIEGTRTMMMTRMMMTINNDDENDHHNPTSGPRTASHQCLQCSRKSTKMAPNHAPDK